MLERGWVSEKLQNVKINWQPPNYIPHQKVFPRIHPSTINSPLGNRMTSAKDISKRFGEVYLFDFFAPLNLTSACFPLKTFPRHTPNF
jgi:hypothetical protein